MKAFLAIAILVGFLLRYLYKSLKTNYKNYISLENIPIEFENIYENLYNNHIHSLELMRKKIVWRTVAQSIAFVLFFIMCVLGQLDKVLVSKQFDGIITIIGYIGISVDIVLIYMNVKYKQKYIYTYKREIVSSFIKLINNELEYKPLDEEAFTTQDDYKVADFDKKAFNRFYSDDYIEGFLDSETFIKMCDLHIQNCTGTGKNRRTEEIFQGLFAHTKCGKDIGTFIKISKDKFKILESQNRVEMDNKEFEEYFDIYSENKIVTMQLLTSDIMESLIDFHNKYNLDYEIVFRNNTIFMRFFTGAMFEPKIFANSMDKQLLFIYFCILKFVLEVTKKANKAIQQIEI